MTIRRGMPERVAAVLGQRIVKGDFPVGQTIPPEAALIAEFSVSRPVLREAIKLLSARGLVEIKQKVGTRVTPRESWALLDSEVLSWQLKSGQDQGSMIRQLIEVRAIVEPAASRLAALRATADQVAAMRFALEEMEKALEVDDSMAFIEADLRFHNGILLGCRNLLLLQMNATVASSLRMSREISSRSPSASVSSIPLHKALLDRIAAQQPFAAQMAAERLVDRTRSDIAALLPDVDFSDD